MAKQKKSADTFLFPYHKQRGDMACGIACLRMIEEWLTKRAHSEDCWREKLNNNKKLDKIGLSAKGMRKALKELAKACEKTIEVKQVDGLDDWNKIPKTFIEKSLRGRCAYVIRMDYFLVGAKSKIKNPLHYIVVYDFLEYQKSDPDCDRKIFVARYNCTQDGEDCVWAWPSLLAARVHNVFEICKAE